MASYLIIAHQTAGSPKLAEKLRELAAEDPTAKFVLLVPATRVSDLIIPAEGEPSDIAWRRAKAAAEYLESVDIPVARTEVGDESPMAAIGHELRRARRGYDAVVISTYPLGASRWLRQDLPNQVKKKFSLPVIHVVTDAPLRRMSSHIHLARRRRQ